MCHFTIERPSPSLADWIFCMFGYRWERGATPTCKRVYETAIRLEEFINSGALIEISHIHEESKEIEMPFVRA